MAIYDRFQRIVQPERTGLPIQVGNSKQPTIWIIVHSADAGGT